MTMSSRRKRHSQRRHRRPWQLAESRFSPKSVQRASLKHLVHGLPPSLSGTRRKGSRPPPPDRPWHYHGAYSRRRQAHHARLHMHTETAGPPKPIWAGEDRDPGRRHRGVSNVGRVRLRCCCRHARRRDPTAPCTAAAQRYCHYRVRDKASPPPS